MNSTTPSGSSSAGTRQIRLQAMIKRWQKWHTAQFAGAAMFFALCGFASGQTINVGNDTDLNNAIQTINTNPTTNYTLNFTNGFSLNQPVLNFASQGSITLKGNSSTIDGTNLFLPLVVNSGTVTVQSLNLINSSDPIKINGGTLVDATGSVHSSVITNGIFKFDQPDAITYEGDISGTGGVQINGAGSVTFTGTNTYQGGTLISPGAKLISTTANLPNSPVFNFGTLNLNQSTAGTLSSNISGLGVVTITGTGPVTLTGLNTYSGGTSVDTMSTLIGTTTSLQGDIEDRGTIIFDQATAGTFNGGIWGAGKVNIVGAGPVTFSNTNSYTGGTTVNSGSTLIGNTDGIQGAITNNGLIQFSQNSNGVYSGNMSGTGSLRISNGGSVGLTGLNTYTGGTTIDSGSILTGSTKSLQGLITNNGAVKFLGGETGAYSGNMSGTGNVEIVTNATVTLTGNNTYTGGTTVSDNATLIGTTSSLQGSIVDKGLIILKTSAAGGAAAASINNPIANSYVPTSIFNGNISGTGKLQISGGGITTLNGPNTYSGGTTVDAGSTLMGSTTSIQGNIANDGFLRFLNDATPAEEQSSQTANGLYSGKISGAGGVQISGETPIIFSGNNTYTGGTIIDSGSSLIGATNSIQGRIINDGSVFFSQLSAGTYSGNMSGIGSLTINGGPVTLAGTNSYTGGTFVNSSSSVIGTTNSLQGSISNSGTIGFDQSFDGTYAGVISGTGKVEVSGLGLTTFTGANTYTGGTGIGNAGTLVINGSILGNVDVNNSGTLMGTGIVGNTTVHAGGTIAPGTIGSPLTINGNFVQGSGSTYTTRISAADSDEVAVIGTAQIGEAAKLNITVDPGTLTVGKRYDILSATGGVTGKYATVFTDPLVQHVVFNEQYGANNLALVVNSNLAPYAQTSNQSAVATVLDQASGTATGAFATGITQLTILDSAQLPSALNQLAGNIYSSIGTIERQTTTVQLQLMSNRLATLSPPGQVPASVAQRANGVRLVSRQASDDQPSNGATTGSSTPYYWTTWAQGYGLGGNVSGDSNVGGVNYRLGGTLFGTERWLNDNWMVGVLGGYAGTMVDSQQNGSNAQINAYQVGLYQLYKQEGLYVSNLDAYGNSSYDVSRPINFGDVRQTASGSSSANQWAHYTEAGLTYELDEFRFQPFLGLQYMYLNQKGNGESGAGSFDLTTDGQTISSVRNSFGARVYHEANWRGMLVIPSLSARYQHEWGNGTQLVTSSFAGAPTSQFAVLGANTGRDFGLFTLSATAYVTPRFSLYGSVDSQVAANYWAVIGAGGLQYSW